MEQRFKAHVQYDDWTGSSAADDSGQRDMGDLLRERGAIGDGDSLVGIKLWVGENHGGKIQRASVSAIVVNRGVYKDIDEMLKREDPVPVKRIDLDMTVEEFIGLFKRFAVTFSLHGQLDGRSYRITEEVSDNG